MKKILFALILLILFTFSIPSYAKEKDINDYVNIAFTIDNNYPVYTMLAINSIMENKKPDTEYKFYILEDNISFINKRIMKLFAKKKNFDLTFYHVSTESFDKGRNIYNFLHRITPIGMARILLPSYMPNELKKVLYLDADILVTTDLKELYDIDIENYYAGMIINNQPMTYEIYDFGEKYYNSGVILINLEKWRKDKIQDKMTTYLKENWSNFDYIKPEKGKNFKFMYPDQDLINLILRDNIKTLDNKWNMQFFAINSLVGEDFKGIIHYIGAGKPWLNPPKLLTSYKMYYKNWHNSPLVVFLPFCKYKNKVNDKFALYKDIEKLYKDIKD